MVQMILHEKECIMQSKGGDACVSSRSDRSSKTRIVIIVCLNFPSMEAQYNT